MGEGHQKLEKRLGGLTGAEFDRAYARSQVRDHEHAVSDVFKWEDPLPAFGFLYPMAVFLKHGRVSTELLVSEGRAGLKAASRA